MSVQVFQWSNYTEKMIQLKYSEYDGLNVLYATNNLYHVKLKDFQAKSNDIQFTKISLSEQMEDSYISADYIYNENKIFCIQGADRYEMMGLCLVTPKDRGIPKKCPFVREVSV